MAIGSLIVKIGADISGIRRDAARGAESLGSLQRGARTLGATLKVLAVGVVARELSQMVRGALEAVDASAKLSRQLGGTIDGLQGLRIAASEAGVSASALTTASEMLNRRLGEAARKGSGEAYEALKRLGLTAEELSQMDADERIAELADAFDRSGASAQEVADTMARLGVRQAEFTRLLMDGGGPIRNARRLIDELGLSLSEVDAAKVEEANDMMERVRIATTAIGQKLVVQLSPILTAISNQFIDMAKDSRGFGDTITRVVELGVKGFGYVGDAVRGVTIVFKAVELAAWSMADTVVKVFQAGLGTITTFVDGAISTINGLIEASNRFAGTDFTPIGLVGDSPAMRALQGFADGVASTTKAVADQLLELSTSEWPSDNAKRLFEEYQAAAQQAAEEIVKHRQAITGLGGEEDETEQAEKEAQALRDRLSGQLDVLREHAMSEEELQTHRYQRQHELLNTALDKDLVALDEYARLSKAIEKRHMEDLASTRKEGMDEVNRVTVMSTLQGVQQILGGLKSLTAGAARENKTMFAINKAFAIADATISGAMGVAKTYAAYSYPLNVGFAAAHAALAAAQVGMIAAQQYQGRSSSGPRTVTAGGGGGAGGLGGGMAAPGRGTGGGSAVAGGASQLVQINMQGDQFSRGTVLALIEEINEAVSDGARITAV